MKNSEICALARAVPRDIETAARAIEKAKKPRIHTFMSSSEIHLKYQFKKTQKEALKMSVDAVKLAKKFCSNVQFSAMDAGRTEKKFLAEMCEAAIDAGADTINITDTVGYLLPEEFGNLIKFLIKNVKNSDRAIFATHCHNDLGLAVANSLAGIQNGARQIECTINGIGERAGNAALEEIVMILQTRKNFFENFTTKINSREISATSKLIQQITGQKVQLNKAIVGKNAFAHESGIHQHGILAARETYEILTPESIGLEKNSIILGKHSGRAALQNRLENLGYKNLSREKISEIFEKFKILADKKKEISDADLDILLMPENFSKKNWTLEKFFVQSGSGKKSSAEIFLKKSGQIFSEKCSGTGMIDAAFSAINKICGKTKLTEFSVDAVTAGIDANAIVKIRIEKNGEIFCGRAGDTDIVRAAILAFLDAKNKIEK